MRNQGANKPKSQPIHLRVLTASYAELRRITAEKNYRIFPQLRITAICPRAGLSALLPRKEGGDEAVPAPNILASPPAKLLMSRRADAVEARDGRRVRIGHGHQRPVALKEGQRLPGPVLLRVLILDGVLNTRLGGNG